MVVSELRGRRRPVHRGRHGRRARGRRAWSAASRPGSRAGGRRARPRARRRRPRRRSRRSSRSRSSPASAAAWAVPTLGALAAGMDRSDSLWYHMPLAARLAQTGHVGPIAFFDPIYFASFYPANSEIPHALGILVFDRDILSPLLNHAWLALALLAAWCIGRPYGLGPQCADRRLGGAGRADAGGVPGRRGPERHHGRGVHAGRGRDTRERLRARRTSGRRTRRSETRQIGAAGPARPLHRAAGARHRRARHGDRGGHQALVPGARGRPDRRA